MATSTFTQLLSSARILLLLLANVFYKPAGAVRDNGRRLNTSNVPRRIVKLQSSHTPREVEVKLKQKPPANGSVGGSIS